ncbi:MAG: DUF898 family protein [Bacteroidales bacterium]|nr:DUF898 family protein [Bacteroidales bacterium]
MKRYFDFTLKGAELFPLWILYWLFVLVPRHGLPLYKRFFINDQNDPLVIALVTVGALLLILSAMVILYYYINRIYIQHAQYDNHPLQFNGTFSSYLEAVIPGIILTMITFTLYLPWLIRDYIRYFVDNSSLKSKNLKFLGKGNVLFAIYLFVVVPVLVAGYMLSVWKNIPLDQAVLHWIPQVVQYVFMIPVLYLFYKWLINVEYRGFRIRSVSRFWPSLWKIMVELFFSVLTLGIYIPMMCIQLYIYFAVRTVAENKQAERYVGFDKDPLNDYLLIWGQILLSVLTLGIYVPWAIAKVGKVFLSRTYLSVSEEV